MNRSASPYGAGWAVAGVEELYLHQRSNAVLLVRGDGSGAVYDSVAPGRYRAPPGACRDTLVRIGSGQNTSYLRVLLNGDTIFYNGNGQQTSVVDRLGNRVRYHYAGTLGAGLDTVWIAPQSANRHYDFAYTSGKLTGITDPAGRTLGTTVSSGGGVHGSLRTLHAGRLRRGVSRRSDARGARYHEEGRR